MVRGLLPAFVFLLFSIVAAAQPAGAGQPAGAAKPTAATKPAAAVTQPPEPLKIDSSFTNFIRPMIGGGFSWRMDDVVDFTDTNNVLLVQNDSKFRTAALAGFFVPFTNCAVEWEAWQKKRPVQGKATDEGSKPACYYGTTDDDKPKFWTRAGKRLGAVFNIQFAQGSQSTVDGFMFGLGFLLRPGIIVNGGYTRALGKELSPGFQRAGVAAIEGAVDPAYARFADLVKDKSGLRQDNYWDGFPLVYGPNNTAVFPSGGAIINSYNGSITVGVSVALDAILRTPNQ